VSNEATIIKPRHAVHDKLSCCSQAVIIRNTTSLITY